MKFAINYKLKAGVNQYQPPNGLCDTGQRIVSASDLQHAINISEAMRRDGLEIVMVGRVDDSAQVTSWPYR